jgi:hypothetical protein
MRSFVMTDILPAVDFARQSKLALQCKVNEGADMEAGAVMADDTQSGGGAGRPEGPDPDEGGALDLQQASAILQEAGQKAQRELRVNHPATYVTWGLVYLIGYGAIWLAVRHQHPYQAPPPYAILAIFLLAAVALTITAALVSRAVSGVGGESDHRRRLTYLALGAGYGAVLVMEAALSHAGASQGVVGIFGAAGPILLIGLVFTIGSPSRSDWNSFGLGIWMLAAAAGAGFAGPAGVWAVLALAVGAGFLGAAVTARLGRNWS